MDGIPYWNSELAYPASVLKGRTPAAEEMVQAREHLDAFVLQQNGSPYLQSLQNSELSGKIKQKDIFFRWGEAEIVYDQPEKILHDFSKSEYHLSPILQPYFEEIKEELKEKKRPLGSSNASLHAKSFVFDRDRVFIGSLNLDPRSVDHNTEIGVVFTSPEIAGEMEDWFDLNIDKLAFRLVLHRQENGSPHIRWHGLENGRNRVFDVEPHAGFWRRFGVAFVSLLPIQSQL